MKRGKISCSCDSDSFGQEKNNKHKHFGRDGVRDKQEPFLGQTGPLPGTNRDPSLGQTGRSLFNYTVKSPFCPVYPWDGWGFVPGTIVPQGSSEKCLCVFCLLFFCPQIQGRKRNNPNPNFLVRIFSGGVGVFHVKGWGPKSSVCPSKPRETKLFGGISRDVAGISRGARNV